MFQVSDGSLQVKNTAGCFVSGPGVISDDDGNRKQTVVTAKNHSNSHGTFSGFTACSGSVKASSNTWSGMAGSGLSQTSLSDWNSPANTYGSRLPVTNSAASSQLDNYASKTFQPSIKDAFPDKSLPTAIRPAQRMVACVTPMRYVLGVFIVGNLQ